MFDFNTLVDLYRVDKLDEAREYLYENVMVLCTQELMAWINQDLHEDIVQDVFMKIDERIQLSISKWYKIRQIYSYIKLRVSWFIINYYKFEIGKYHIETNYEWEDDWSECESEREEILSKCSIDKFPALLLESLGICESDERQVMYLYYNWLDFKRISNILAMDKSHTKKLFNSSCIKIKSFLQSKWLTYEDLC